MDGLAPRRVTAVVIASGNIVARSMESFAEPPHRQGIVKDLTDSVRPRRATLIVAESTSGDL